MSLYEIVVDLIGTLPEEFTFIYAILTLVVAFMLVASLCSLFYIILRIIRGVL